MTNNGRRLFSAVQLATGLATLVKPRAVVSALTPQGSAVPDTRIVRVLGLRQAVQGAVGTINPTSEVLWAGAVVDALHALSLVPIIACSSRYRAAAGASAAMAATAVAGGAAFAATS